MDIRIYGFLLVLFVTNGVDCNCGCLKCCKNLKVVSPPNAPIKVIYRQPLDAAPCASFQKPIPYSVQVPVLLPPLPPALPLPPIRYHIVAPKPKVQQCAEPLYKYQYQLQVPILPPPPPPLLPLTGLVARPDRVVLPAPGCAPLPPLREEIIVQQPEQVLVQVPKAVPSGPIIEQLPDDFVLRRCDCRYDHNRKKRQIPIIKNSIDFLAGFLPSFMRSPYKNKPPPHSYFHRNAIGTRLGRKIPYSTKTHPHKPLNPYIFLNKIKQLNREKRSIVFGDSELSLPFLQVTEVEDEEEYGLSALEQLSSESLTSDELYSEESKETLRQQYLKPLNFDHIVPHNPIFYMLNTPIRLLHHFHKLGQQITPIFTSVPNVLINSRKYLRNFGRTFKKDVLNFASNVVGDFDDLNQPTYYQQGQGRYRRDVGNLRRTSETEKFRRKYNEDAGRFRLTSKANQRRIRRRKGLTSLRMPKETDRLQKRHTKRGRKTFAAYKLQRRSIKNQDVTKEQSKRFPRDVRITSEVDTSIDESGYLKESSEATKPHVRHIKARSRISESQERPHRDLPNRNMTSESYKPDYSLAFPKRPKRYILKVVDEDEVDTFLREKLGHFVEPKPKKRESKKKLVVEKLSPKLIIDNNGRPFYEINGYKRPLFRRKHAEDGETHKTTLSERMNSDSNLRKKNAETVGLFWNKSTKDDTKAASQEKVETMNSKISELIEKAQQRMDQKSQMPQNEISTKVIKERIGDILMEVESLINLDFNRYSKIHTDLVKVQSFKNYLVSDWLEVLSNAPNDIQSKIRILNDFQELQTLRDTAVIDIANLLKGGTNFMTKKLIRMLVRLQKLQCITNKFIDEFSEKIQSGLQFDIEKEVKYLEYLQNLDFVTSGCKMEQVLKDDRDAALEKELDRLDELREILQEDNMEQSYAEAKVLWEIKNIEKLQKDTIEEMDKKLMQGQKIRKELKILFDLQRQLENCEEKQQVLLEGKSHKSSEESAEKPINVVDLKSPHKTIIDDKKPVKIISNGYSLTAYKVHDAFD